MTQVVLQPETTHRPQPQRQAILPVTGDKRRFPIEAKLALGFLVIVLAAVAVGPMLWTADPEAIDLSAKYLSPGSTTAPLGTDDYGRDILSRILHGGRLSFAGAFVVLAGSSGFGLLLGATAGFNGGRWDAFVGRHTDVCLALPSLVVALGIVGTLGRSFPNLILALVLTGWPWYARIYRSLVIRERGQVYVLAAHALGASRTRILWRHIGPNILGPVLVVMTINLGNAMLSLAALSFLGLGVRPPTPEWGAMVSDARFHFQTHPWLIFCPGIVISLCTLAINTLGDALRDFYDPQRYHSPRRAPRQGSR